MRCALLLLLAVAPAAAQMYTWTDEAGVEHYSSEPPKEKAKARNAKVEHPDTRPIVFKKAGALLPSGLPSVKPVKAAAPKSGGPLKVELFATSWCPACRRAREYFAARKVEYTEYDIEKDGEAAARFAGYGAEGVPLILVNGVAVKGFSQPSLDALLAGR